MNNIKYLMQAENAIQVKDLSPGDWFIGKSELGKPEPPIYLYVGKEPNIAELHRTVRFDGRMQTQEITDTFEVIKVQVTLTVRLP